MTSFIRKDVAIALVVLYFIFLVPYAVHANLEDAGVVKDRKVLSTQNLPEDIGDIIKSEECTVLLVENGVSEERFVVISPEMYLAGEVVEVTDKIINWRVDWHEYGFFEESYENLIVGDVGKVAIFETSVESILAGQIGSVIFVLSKIDFFIGALLVITYLSFSFSNRLYLWNILAIISLYSFEIFFGNIFADLHNVIVSDTSKYFGYIFVVLIPLTYIFRKYEESEEGQKRMKKLYEKISELITGKK